MGQFGDKFRIARESKNLSLDDVSNGTKIAARMLQAIEQEHFDQLPGGVFNKGFIRAYAKHLGLNDEEAVTDYLACLRQAQIDAHEVWQPSQPAPSKAATPANRRPTTPAAPTKPAASAQVDELPHLQLPRAEDMRPRKKEFLDHGGPNLPWKIPALAIVLIAVLSFFWIRHSRTTSTAAASTSRTASPPTANAPSNSEPGQLPPTSLSANAAPPQTASAPPPSPPPSVNLPAASLAAGSPTTSNLTSPKPASPAPAAAGTAPAATSAKSTEPSDVSVYSSQKTPAKAADTTPPPLKLVIRATETSWISVTSDGQTASQETLIAPADASIKANREIVARIGNAAGVTFLFNGQEIPAGGAEAEVKTFLFDSTGMRVVPNNPPVPAQQ